jgi:hypothetical protein
MNRMGYWIHVMRNAFVVHKGFKTKAGFHDNMYKEHAKNRSLLAAFLGELKKKYGK